jgi:hypothetical protein
MAEEIKQTKSIGIVEESAEQKNIKLGIALAIMFALGFVSSAYLFLSGFFG